MKQVSRVNWYLLILKRKYKNFYVFNSLLFKKRIIQTKATNQLTVYVAKVWTEIVTDQLGAECYWEGGKEGAESNIPNLR